MALYTPATYVGDGATVSFAVPFDYLNRSDVIVTVGGVVVSAYTWTSSATISFNTAPLVGQAIVISRSTSIANPTSNFTAGDLPALALNRASKQAIFGLQELSRSVALLAGLLVYDGTWDAAANTPVLASGIGQAGHYRIVSNPGSTTLDGVSTWIATDLVVFDGTHWSRIASASMSVASTQIIDSTAVGRALLTSASVAAQRASLGLATVAATGSYSDLLSAPTLPTPQVGGRLTLQSGVPVMYNAVSGGATVYFTPDLGFIVPAWNGSTFVSLQFTELSQALSDATKSPAAAAASSLYDMFVWLDGATLRCTRGPAWTSTTSRGTGAGTSELRRTQGLLVNNVTITNGPLAGNGVYVGTIATNGSALVDWVPSPAAASGGAYCALNVWNAFNRRDVVASVQDNVGYTLTATGFRAAHGSTNNRVNFVSGLAEDAIAINYNSTTSTVTTGGAYTQCAVGLDSATSALNGVFTQNNTPANSSMAIGQPLAINAQPQLGSHYVQALEQGDGSHANTYNFSGNALLQIKLRM